MTTFIEKGECTLQRLLTIGTDSRSLSEPGDDSDDDDEIEVGGVTQDYKCPITLTPLQDPLTSYGSLLHILHLFLL
jgi:SUMO ligase MMS21 Smc5/6 complex component